MDIDHTLFEFGTTRRKAVNSYRRFMREGLGQGRLPELTGGGLIRSKGGWSQVLAARRRRQKGKYDERIPGNVDFVNAILKKTEEMARRQLILRRSGKTIEKLVEEKCRKARIGRPNSRWQPQESGKRS